MAQNLTNAGWLMDINKLDFPSYNWSVYNNRRTLDIW